MTKLKFRGDINISEVISECQLEIYDATLNAIKQDYKNLEIESVKVIDISINDFNHSIFLSRNKFVSALSNAIKCYEEIEAYEKCSECLNIINYLKLFKQ